MVGEGSGVTARLVVADEHPVVRRAVRMSCDALSGLEVVGEADTGSDVLSLCEELRPDVAVLDIALPDGLDAIRGLNDRQLVEIVVVLTDRTDGASVMEALRAGVEGGRNPRDAKVLLAKEVTARFHSPAVADAAEQDFVNRSKGGIPDEIPEVTLTGAPLGIAQLLKQAGLAPSTSEANRLVDGGGVRVDSGTVSDKGLKLPAGTYVVQVGKRKFAKVTLV